MNFLDDFLAGYKWYRRLRGGQWWLCVKTHGEYAGAELWVNEQPPRYITVADFEWW